MNTSISKYAPKTKTYGTTISLTNCVLISDGISNLTVKKHWGQVLKMTTETTSFLVSQDTSRFYRKIYSARKDIKRKRAKDNNNKIKEMMEQQKK